MLNLSVYILMVDTIDNLVYNCNIQHIVTFINIAMTRITIEVNEKQKQKMKVLAALSNLSLKNLILDRTIGIEPNEETLRSFDDYQNNRNLTKHNNFDDLIEDLNS